jgi:hypothetical protein
LSLDNPQDPASAVTALATQSQTRRTHLTLVSSDNKLLQRAFAPNFKARGFLKDGATWRRSSPDAIVVFNIQGSQWGRQFYLNLGAYFRQLGPELAPRENRCHIRGRLNALVPDRVLLGKLLDFDEDIPAPDRFTQLAAMVGEFAMPWLDAMSACETARSHLHTHRESTRSMFLASEAQALLAASSVDQNGVASDDPPRTGDRD